MWLWLLLALSGTGGELAPVLAALERREAALTAFVASYHETEQRGTEVERFGPRRFAWCPDCSLYRGPKTGKAQPILSWLTGERVTRETLYYKDSSQNFWLRRELEPVGLVWQGSRDTSKGPDFRNETGYFHDDLPLSVLLRRRTVEVEDWESVDGDLCVRLLVIPEDGNFPDVFYLSKVWDYFPRRLVRYTIGGPGRASRPNEIQVGENCWETVSGYEWSRLRRRGEIVFPTRIRYYYSIAIPPVDRTIEIDPASVRFGEEVTADDFALPSLVLLDDRIEDDYAVLTPLGILGARRGAAIAMLVAVAGGLLYLRRVRRRMG